MKESYSSKKEQMLYIETATQRIIQVLFTYPDKEFSLTDLSKEANVRKSNIGYILDKLHKIGFIEITKLSKIWRIMASRTNWNFIKHKMIYNLALIYQSGIVEFLVDYFKNPKSIILFGSFRKGEDISNSDIDIAIESDDFNEYKITSLRELAEFKVIEKNIQLHLFNRKHIDISLFNNIANGIVLWGFLEVKS